MLAEPQSQQLEKSANLVPKIEPANQWDNEILILNTATAAV